MDGKKKLEELVAGLDGVTPGPWTWGMRYVSHHPDDGAMHYDQIFSTPNGMTAPDGDRWEKNAAHIARCDPDTIRSISDAYKAMEAENERLKSHLITKDENDG